MLRRWLGVSAAVVVLGMLASTAPAAGAADPGPLDCGTVAEQQQPVPGVEREAVLDTLPVGTTWAGHYVDQALLTDGDDQYVAYYDATRRLTVAHRTLDSDQWTHVRLDETLGWDSHNYLTMTVDRDGHLHVAGNMHGVPLVYFRTTIARDVTSLTRVGTMVDPALERRVTYPVFLELQDGTVVFRYRDGSSGAGVDIYNQYDESTRTWSGLVDTALLDGEGERNAYAAKPVLGPDGKYHMVWVWRETPNAATSHTVSYARTADLVNWETSKGEPLALPITLGTSDAVDPVPPFGGTINNNIQVGFDGSGAPVVAYHKYDAEGNTQVYVARPDGSESGWQNIQVSDWSGAWEFGQTGTLVFQVEIYWAPELLPDGNLRLDVTCLGDARTFILDGATLEPIEEIATPPVAPAAVTEVRSDYVHEHEGELGTEMQVNLNDDSGDSGPFHTMPSLRDPDLDRRDLMRWESLGENRDRPRAQWPEAQPLEVAVLGTMDACKDGGWRGFFNPGFGNEGECVSWVQTSAGPPAMR
jgi:BNR repeat-containing family member